MDANERTQESRKMQQPKSSKSSSSVLKRIERTPFRCKPIARCYFCVVLYVCIAHQESYHDHHHQSYQAFSSSSSPEATSPSHLLGFTSPSSPLSPRSKTTKSRKRQRLCHPSSLLHKSKECERYVNYNNEFQNPTDKNDRSAMLPVKTDYAAC